MDMWDTDPQVNQEYAPKNDLPQWAIGSAFRTVHEGANKYLSNTAVVEIYKVGYEMVQDYQTY